MQYNDLLSLKATCKAIFPLSDLLRASAMNIDIIDGIDEMNDDEFEALLKRRMT